MRKWNHNLTDKPSPDNANQMVRPHKPILHNLLNYTDIFFNDYGDIFYSNFTERSNYQYATVAAKNIVGPIGDKPLSELLVI